MYFPVLTWMLDISKLAQRATHGSGYRVGGLRLSCPRCSHIYVCGRETQHMQVWRVDLFSSNSNRASSCFPVSNASCWFQPVWVTRDEVSMQVSSMFLPFIWAACKWCHVCYKSNYIHTQTGHPVHLACFLFKSFFFVQVQIGFRKVFS